MNYDAFINKYEGQPIDFDGLYGPQCVDMVAQYCVENGMPVAYANAADWWQHPALTDAFDFIANDPNDPNQLPNRGEPVIFRRDLPGSGGYGHIDLYDIRIGPGAWQGLDQNWGGQYVHFQQHNWGYVLGWMRPKQQPAPAPEPAPVVAPAPEVPYPAPDFHPDPAPANPPVENPEVPPAPIPTAPELPNYDEENNTMLKAILKMVTALFDYFRGQYKSFAKYVKK